MKMFGVPLERMKTLTRKRSLPGYVFIERDWQSLIFALGGGYQLCGQAGFKLIRITRGYKWKTRCLQRIRSNGIIAVVRAEEPGKAFAG